MALVLQTFESRRLYLKVAVKRSGRVTEESGSSFLQRLHPLILQKSEGEGFAEARLLQSAKSGG